MSIELDVNTLANAKAKGKRPFFFNNPEAEKVMSITMALAMELSVTRDRLDTIERLLNTKNVLTTAEIDAFVPDKIAEQERGNARQDLIACILRIVQQDMDQLANMEPDMETIMDILADPNG